MQKHVNLVDLVKSFPTNIFLQNLASIQKRTSSIKFAHLAEKSEKGSISNLSTKASAAAGGAPPGALVFAGAPEKVNGRYAQDRPNSGKTTYRKPGAAIFFHKKSD